MNQNLFLTGRGACLDSLAGDNVWAGNIVLEAADHVEVDEDQLQVSGSVSNLSLSGSRTVAGARPPGSLFKDGPGVLALQGNNSYSAGITVSAGILSIQTAAALGPGPIDVASGATLAIDATASGSFRQTFRQTLHLSGAGFDSEGALDVEAGRISWSGSMALTGVAFVAVAGGGVSAGPLTALTVSGSIGGDSLDKLGDGTLNLAAANSFTGHVAVLAGTLAVYGNSALGAGDNDTFVYPGATLQAAAPRVHAVLTLLGGTLQASVNSAWDDLIVTGKSSVVVNAGVSLQLHGLINIVSGAVLTKAGAGLLQFFEAPGEPDLPIVALDLSGSSIPDPIVVQAGTVSFGRGTGAAELNVNLAAGFTPAVGTQFTIVNNETSTPMQQTFLGLAEGATFVVAGFTFQVTYRGGGGDDVVIARTA